MHKQQNISNQKIALSIKQGQVKTKLLHSFATISALTIGSRITGFIRETLTASLFGSSVVAEAESL